MSFVALGMNVFLAVLLLAALVMGWRLDRRLRGVRESHVVFAKAVHELDGATARAHAGLAELRAATDEAIDLLGGRLARAREAAERLDRSIVSAEAAARSQSQPQAQIQAPVHAHVQAPPVQARPVQTRPVERELVLREPVGDTALARRQAAAPTNLQGLLEMVENARANNGFTPLRAPAARPAASRFRMADEELFDDARVAL